MCAPGFQIGTQEYPHVILLGLTSHVLIVTVLTFAWNLSNEAFGAWDLRNEAFGVWGLRIEAFGAGDLGN